MNLEELKFLLKRYNLTANKLRGQNFLVSDEVLDKILQISNLNKDDLVLEIGPGLGALTQRLVEEVYQVVTMEIDKKFQEPLDKLVAVTDNLEILWQDILSLSDRQWQNILEKYKRQDYKIVANIPYYLTGKFLSKFLLADKKPTSITLLVQKEVAQRVLDEKQSKLSLSVAFYAKAKIASVVEKQNFYPQPKVDSAILHIYDIKNWPYDVDEKKVWQLVRRGMASKRKKLFNNLLTDQNISKEKLVDVFSELSFDNNIRAERLGVLDWINLAKRL